jgi:hypothetical protein
MGKYNIYPGSFPCHTCGKEVKTIRSYPGEKRLSWMCQERHLTEISLDTKKTRKDYEREE